MKAQVNQMEISVVVPVYNEEGSIVELIERIESVLKPIKKKFELILIDDGSSDRTPEIIRELAVKRKHMEVITFRGNSGKSAALSAGFERSTGKIVITMDGDLQDDPDEIPRFLEAIAAGADMVTGWKRDRKDPMEKRLPSRLFNRVTSYASGIQLHDFNCGFKAYRRQVVQEIPMYGELHRFIPFLAHKMGFQVVEIPVKHHARKYGKSKFGMERYLRGFFDLITVAFLTTFFSRPMHFFGKTALAIIGIGVALFFYLVLGRWIHGVSIGTSPILAVSFLMITIGVQVGIFGLLAELVIYERKRKVPYSLKTGDM